MATRRSHHPPRGRERARARGPRLRQSLAIGLVAVFAGGCGAGGDAERGRPEPRGVVLITVGGWRADLAFGASDARGAGGGSGGLARLAEEGLVFERAYAPSSLAVQSLASIFGGRLPTRGGSIGVVEAQPVAEASTLASRLRRGGVETVLIAQDSWVGRPGFTRGFSAVEVAPEPGWSAGEVSSRALRALDGVRSSGESRYLLAVQLSGPERQLQAASGDEGASAAEGYYSALLEVEEELAKLIEGLAQRGALAESLLVLAGTHGYELGEHGGVGSGWTVYEEVVRVPLVLRWPGVIEPGREAAVVSLVELLPTLVELTGGVVGEGELDGESLLTAEGSGLVSRPGPGPRLVELVVREWAIARAVIEGSAKYIHWQRQVPTEDRQALERGLEELQAAMLSGAIEVPPLFGEAVLEELFDLDADPGEAHSLLTAGADPPPRLSRLQAALRAYRQACDRSAYAPIELTRRLEIDPDQVRELESLGYL